MIRISISVDKGEDGVRVQTMNQADLLPAIAEGSDVIDAKGQKVGMVIACQPDFIVVEHGLFFPHDYCVPLDGIERGDVVLNVTRDRARSQDWYDPSVVESPSAGAAAELP